MVCRVPEQCESRRSDVDCEAWFRRRIEDLPVAPLRLVALDDCAASSSLPAYNEERIGPSILRTLRAMPPSPRQLRLAAARRRRKVMIERGFFALSAAAALIMSLAGGVHLMLSPSGAGGAAPVQVVVAPGDNLWTIASRYSVNGEPTSRTVSAIRAANRNIDDSKGLQVGQQIIVPADR